MYFLAWGLGLVAPPGAQLVVAQELVEPAVIVIFAGRVRLTTMNQTAEASKPLPWELRAVIISYVTCVG